MLSMHQIARSSAARLLALLPDGRQKPEEEVVAYGLEIALGALLQLLVFYVAGCCLGLLPEMMAALFTMATYRLLAGGVHCSAYYRCLLLSLLTLILLASLGRWLAGMSGRYLPGAILAVFVASMAVAWRWAPAPTAAAPIVNPVRRAWLKKASYLWLLAWLAVIGPGYYLGWPGSALYASTGALIFQSFAVTPWGFATVGRVDALLKRLLPLDKNWKEGGDIL
ncbi:MAG: accessory gene regulator B family protein [Moorella sp. (in: Bacteria)]|nr:accessory gene regulator B family protein [Moorella sp. (in: firmicutes)]